MPFQKGQSGNPGGRPKENKEVKLLAQEYGLDAIHKLVRHMEGDDERLAQSAALAILDRGFGKPAQEVNLGGQEDNPLLIGEIARKVIEPETDDTDS